MPQSFDVATKTRKSHDESPAAISLRVVHLRGRDLFLLHRRDVAAPLVDRALTRVIGKAPIELTTAPSVSHSGETIRIKTGGFGHGKIFTAEGDLNIYCARSLILELRTHLRAIRDERTRILNNMVASAEKPLP
jgi:hypothetical protein